MGLLDLRYQVRDVLPMRFGGTGNRWGWAGGVVEPYRNTSGATIAYGTAVRRASNGSGACELDDTDASVEVLGLVVGLFNADGTITRTADVAADEYAAVMTKGHCQALVDSTGGYSRGDYLFVGADADGTVRGDGTVAAGAFGLFEAPGDASALAYVHLFGAPVFGAGGGSSPLTTKGDLFGYSTVDARVPIGSNGKVLTADSGQALGLKWGEGPLTTKGDLFGYSTTGARIAVGSNDKVLVADSSQATGVAWKDGANSLLTTKGDLLTRDSSALARRAVGSNGNVLQADSSDSLGIKWAALTSYWSVQATFYSVANGDEIWTRIPFDCTVDGWDITANASGSIVVDVWSDTYANFPPTVADTIAGSELPTLSAARKNQDTSLSTWTTALTRGRYLMFHVNAGSVSGVATVVVSLYGTRTVNA